MPDPAILTTDAAPWLAQAGFLSLAGALSGPGARTAVVGGAVRDSLTGRSGTPDDLDLVSSHDAARAMSRAKAAGLAASLHPLMPDVVFVDLPGEGYDARHASVRCLGSAAPEAFVADARARDFTVNALLCGLDGRIEDHVGGLDDARARRLRFVSEASAAADPARLIRYFRIRIALGEADPGPEALAIVRRHAPAIGAAPPIRIARELALLLESQWGGETLGTLRLMEGTGLLRALLPGADLARFERYLAGPRAGVGLDAFEALALLGAAGSPLVRYGDWRDEAIAMRAAALDAADGDLGIANVGRCFREVVVSWKAGRDREPAPPAPG